MSQKIQVIIPPPTKLWGGGGGGTGFTMAFCLSVEKWFLHYNSIYF